MTNWSSLGKYSAALELTAVMSGMYACAANPVRSLLSKAPPMTSARRRLAVPGICWAAFARRLGAIDRFQYQSTSSFGSLEIEVPDPHPATAAVSGTPAAPARPARRNARREGERPGAPPGG